MILQLENIQKTYVNPLSGIERKVLKNINFTLKKGDSVSILGPSGCGKSTLLNIIGTMDTASAGKLYWNGKDISTFQPSQLAALRNKRIGFVFQQHHLLPQLTLMENVLLPMIMEKETGKKVAAIQRAHELISWVGLSERIHQFPGQLSVGECQRTAVVRALINEPDVLLADEPTGSLDENTAMDLVDLLCRINAERDLAVIMVTHATDLATKMKKSCKLVGGELLPG